MQGRRDALKEPSHVKNTDNVVNVVDMVIDFVQSIAERLRYYRSVQPEDLFAARAASASLTSSIRSALTNLTPPRARALKGTSCQPKRGLGLRVLWHLPIKVPLIRSPRNPPIKRKVRKPARPQPDSLTSTKFPRCGSSSGASPQQVRGAYLLQLKGARLRTRGCARVCLVHECLLFCVYMTSV